MFPTEQGRTDPDYLKDLPPHSFDRKPSDRVLNIAVIGAGIAGLAAAAGLSRSGHRVEIFERSCFANEVGAAIHVTPNASRVLRYWGFNFPQAKAVPFGQQQVLKGNDLSVLYSGDYSHWPKRYGAEAYFLHRVDLHNGLKQLALEDTANSHSAELNLSSEVVDVDYETGILILANGKTVEKDLVVAADGVHSRFTRKVTDQDTPAQPTGHSAFRFVIPQEKLLESSETRVLLENALSGMNISAIGDRRLVWYPCRSGELYNFVGIHPEIVGESYLEEWNVAAPLQKLLETYSDFNPALIAVCKKAEDLKLWKLLFRNPCPSWTKGKIVLIGDAAHPMLPHQGQGGAQAIEDGAALGALFSHIQSVDDIPERLNLFEQVRRNRASAMQMFSNAGQDEAEKIEKDAQPFVDGPVPSKNPGRISRS